MALDYVIDGKIGIDLTATYASTSSGSSTFFPAKPGDRVNTTNNGVYMFCRAASTISQYMIVGFGPLADSATAATGTFAPQAVPLTTTNAAASGVVGPNMVGIAQTSIDSSRYGWIALNGTNLRVQSLIACQPNVLLFTTGTAGNVDDAVVSAGQITGLTLITSATSASAARCIASWPHLDQYAVQA